MPSRRSIPLLALAALLLAGCAPGSAGGIRLACPDDASQEARPFPGGVLHACVDAAGLDHGPQRAVSDGGGDLFAAGFVRGEPHGIAEVAAPPGQSCCHWDYAFDHGRPLWRRGRDEGGRLFAEWIYDFAGQAAVRRWHPNGAQSDAFQVVNDEIEGRWLHWWPNGQLQRDAGWRNGQLQGPFREWYADGRPRIDGRYEDGRRIGEWSVWSESGDLVDRRRHGDTVPAAPR